MNTLLGSPRHLICQCCGMPLDDSSISKEPDGTFNEEYCKWCYAEGKFTYNKQYGDMYDKFVKIYFKDGSVRVGLFNDEFYEDSSILVSCEVIKIADIEKMELFEE